MARVTLTNFATYERHLLEESNRALEKGGLLSAVFATLTLMLSVIFTVTGVAQNLLSPGLMSLFALAYSLMIFYVARRRRLAGVTLYVVFLPFVTGPSLFLLQSHFLMDAGAATYISGPITHLYIFLIVITGFVFNPRLSIFSGIAAGTSYVAIYFLAREELMRIQTHDPTMAQDIAALPFHCLKAAMIIFSGLVVAGLAVIAKRLIVRVLEEEHQKVRISGLFGQYVSPEVSEKIVKEEAPSQRGERKLVALLFSDLRNFSTYSEGRDPEDIVVHLNEYFDAMVQCIRSEGGVVDKFIGDAIMAVFGGVTDLRNPSESALVAAMKMRTQLRDLNRRWAELGLERFDNGIGMHFGEVLQGSIGSADRKEFTVIGDSVNTAARLEGLTKESRQKVIITDALYSELPEEMRSGCTDLGTVSVRGKREEIRIWGVRTP